MGRRVRLRQRSVINLAVNFIGNRTVSKLGEAVGRSCIVRDRQRVQECVPITAVLPNAVQIGAAQDLGSRVSDLQSFQGIGPSPIGPPINQKDLWAAELGTAILGLS